MRPLAPPNYLAGYPAHLADSVREAIAQGKLGVILRKNYPQTHDVRTDRALYNYVQAMRNRHLKNSAPLSKVAYDAKLQLLHKALGTHSTIPRIQGRKLKAKREIRVVHYNIINMLELGTSLGISSAYLGISNTKSRIITLEGDPEIASLAKEVHQNLILRNIDIKIGPFSSTLSPALKEIQHVDLAFLDGHHAMEPTLAYYEQLKPFCHDNSIIGIDDIYWSEGMQSAWKNLIERPEVTLSIDLYDVGILFFKKELTKKHASYIPYKYKPWRIGLFG